MKIVLLPLVLLTSNLCAMDISVGKIIGSLSACYAVYAIGSLVSEDGAMEPNKKIQTTQPGNFIRKAILRPHNALGLLR
jgi:hypothetical protein